MSNQDIYVISNASMDIFPNNSRSKFANLLPKVIKPEQEKAKTLYISLENLIFEKTLFQYKSELTPDIYWVNPRNSDTRKFYLKTSRFDSPMSFLIHLRNEIRNATQYFQIRDGHIIQNNNIVKIKYKLGLFIVKTSKVVNMYFSKKNSTFLGFSVTNRSNGNLEFIDMKNISNNSLNYVEMYKLRKTGIRGSGLKADKKFCLDLLIPNSIQVICKNIEPNLTSEGHNSVIEMVPLTSMKNILDYQPKIRKYYRINTNELKSIQVELHDENDELVKFDVGFPTILKFKIAEMSIVRDNFYIRVSSNDSKLTFPANNSSQFWVKLPKELRLGLNWKTSLTSIYLPRNIHNIYESMNVIELYQYHDSSMSKIKASFKVLIQPGYYNSSHSLCNAINIALTSTPINLNFHEESKRFFFSGSNKNGNDKSVYKISFTRKLIGILGYEPRLLIDDDGSKLSLNFRYSRDYNDNHNLVCDTFSTLDTNSSVSNSFLFPKSPNLNFSISPWIFVYCNIIKPSITGHARVPLLKIVPLNFHDFQRGHALEFENLEFSSLSLNSFQSLHFEIRNHDGTLLSTDNDNLMMTLLFQKEEPADDNTNSFTI